MTAIELHLLALDQDSRNSEAIHAIFRGYHTIKGLAGFLELSAIQQIAHEVEPVLDLARNGQISVTAAHIDVILASKDYLCRWMAELEEMLKNGTAPTLGPDGGLLAAVRRLAASSGAGVDDPANRDTVPSALSALSSAALEKAPSGAGDNDSRPAETRAIRVDTAQRLNQACRIRVQEARDGDALEPGLALLAQGNFHLKVRRAAGAGYRAIVGDGPPSPLPAARRGRVVRIARRCGRLRRDWSNSNGHGNGRRGRTAGHEEDRGAHHCTG